MNLMIEADTLRPNPHVSAASANANAVSYTIADRGLSRVLVVRSAKGVCSTLLGDNADRLTADLANRFQQSALAASNANVKDDMTKVLRYIDHALRGLVLTLDMRGAPFQRHVWEKLKAIAAGKTLSYAQPAQRMNPLANPRAATGGCAANSIALAIPCHRVIRSNDDLAGYRWDIERKRTLIQKEAVA